MTQRAADHPEEQEKIVAVEPPGRRLRQAREGSKLSVAEVASQLRLDEEVISALEADRFEKLPGPAFIRGYLRSYARLLGLPPEELIQGFDQNTEQADSQPLVVHRPIKGGLQSKRSRSHWPLSILVLLIVAAVAILLWQSDVAQRLINKAVPVGNEPDQRLTVPGNETGHTLTLPPPPKTLEPASGGAEVTDVPPVVEPALPGPPPEAVIEPPTPLLPEAGVAVTTAESPVEPEAPAASGTEGESGVVTEAEPAAELQPPAAPVVAAETDALELRFEQDCWVEITDADNRRLLYDLVKAGETRRITGKTPFNIMLGNARGVTAVFNGKPVDLAPYTHGNVARLSLDATGNL